MNASLWARVNAVFQAALEREGEAREAWVVEACGGDAELLAEVRSLLSADARAGAFLDAPANLPVEAPPPDVGPWHIKQELGRGGMGTVYLAERSDGVFAMQAALKLLRRGLDTDDLLARFRDERQILASLQHPNIARLLDGGATAEGRPWLVMEYVEGQSLLDWCTQQKLDVEGRLALFQKLCSAVQYAHRNLVVHRDLKPGNVLVTAGGELKLLDFGIAKVLGEEPGEERTKTGQQLLTPAYASPEQVRGERVTTAADVWALGVILYELLVGRRPFEGSGETLSRAILEADPPSPRLGGDLDTIILTALRKEPELRYATVDQLADDLLRSQARLPVRARPATFGYRLGKFLARNRFAVVAASLVSLSLVGGVVSTVLQAREARAARERAEASRARAEELVDFMLGDLRKKLEPSSRLDVLEDVSKAVQSYFETVPAEELSPQRRARMLNQLATVRLAQSKGDEAAALIKNSRELLAGAIVNAETDGLRAAAANLQGRVYEEQRGELAVALTEFELASSLLQALLDRAPADADLRARAGDAANDEGRVLYALGRPADAVKAHRRGVEGLQGVEPKTRDVRLALAKSYLYLGRAQEAVGAARDALASFSENLGRARALRTDFPQDLELEDYLSISLNDLGRITRLGGKPAEAEVLATEAVALSEAALARDPENAIRLDGLSAAHSFLGRAREDQDKLEGALSEYREDVKISERLLAKEAENAFVQAALADGLTNVGRVERKQGHAPAARELHGRALALREALAKSDESFQVDVGVSCLELGRVQRLEGQDPRASLVRALEIFQKAGGADDAPAKQRGRLAQVLIELGRLEDARPIVRALTATGAADAELRALASKHGL
ncbi:MAG: protein kinase [Archangium sp.]|nr:protein kinase [Archangium sp.]